MRLEIHDSRPKLNLKSPSDQIKNSKALSFEEQLTYLVQSENIN